MEELFPEYLRTYFNPNKIDLGLYEERTALIYPNRLILLNKNDSEKEQILSLLHEVVHMHPNFLSYTGGLWDGFPRNKEMESQIEEHAKQIYEKRKDIVRLAKETIDKARRHPLNISD